MESFKKISLFVLMSLVGTQVMGMEEKVEKQPVQKRKYFGVEYDSKKRGGYNADMLEAKVARDGNEQDAVESCHGKVINSPSRQSKNFAFSI